MKYVLVVGASGFVGAAVCRALDSRGFDVVRMRAPRLKAETALKDSPELGAIESRLAGSIALVNCAGLSDATAVEAAALSAANGLLPGLLAELCEAHGVRFVHVSSAAVQGRARILDASEFYAPFSEYSRSKVLGEKEALKFGSSVVYRPPGVHGINRSVTKALARFARSRFVCVAGDGSSNSPQALIENVADAIAFLATCEESPPEIVSHPSEGVTVGGIVEDLGMKRPATIPAGLGRVVVASAFALSRLYPRLAGQARRLEMLWFGQSQDQSWLSLSGWEPVRGRDRWREIGGSLSTRQ